MLQGMYELHFHLCMKCESVSMHILRTCAHIILYVNRWHAFEGVLSPQPQNCSQSCTCTADITEELLELRLHDTNIICFCTFSLRIVALYIDTYIMIYTHLLTSSSSENLHELLSSVIILEHIHIAESASMSCGVSAA